MDRCPKCHSMLFGNVNFCSCGKFHYNPREVGRHPNPPRRGRYLVYRKGFDANDDGVKFDLTPPPPALPAKKEVVPGWMWAKRKKDKKLREEAQETIKYVTQLNLFGGLDA